MIAPIFESKCLSCHNSLKSKGDFLMSSYENLLKSGKSGLPSVVSGLVDSSELFKRVTLPENHADHMPPEGKTPLSKDEIALLKVGLKQARRIPCLVREVRKKQRWDN